VSATELIDLEHLGLRGAIGVYVILGEEPALVDPGPSTTLERLRAGLAALGVGPEDLRHILLTHVHLDHAGATGHLVEAYPHARVHVHEGGAPHMVDPTRLVASTRRTFGEAHDRLWGEVKPVPSERIRGWSAGARDPLRGIRPIPTPGHIDHHLAFLDEGEGTLLAGDAMGIILAPGAPSHPPTPPPSVDLRAWENTLSEVRAIGPERFGVTHFGLHDDAVGRAQSLQTRLDALEARVRRAMEQGGGDEDATRFNDEVMQEFAPFLGEDQARRYFDLFSAATDWRGVRFYLERNPDTRRPS